ncbi:heme NO-binding domain-containing protein [Neptuniibacter sp.]|uniref:heme NO-binding domain-containing protein n=1 Tax=Neptuniibacter sp. TaxID=1962643 RepID=UPI002603F147|nr:heme NO-binding domain-containing protein [Neptuniibacter sp.]MCP4598399.1 hypothetical protein [Neptuniibacter sp.]
MKGVIFNVLEEMVVEHLGMAHWNKILEQSCPDNHFHTAGDSYPDSELFTLVEHVSTELDKPIEEVVGAFGEYLFAKLAERYPIFVDSEQDLKSFLKSVDSVIHMEVKKLYDSPNLPQFTYSEPDNNHLVMQYRSPRKLCILAEGLIRGAAMHYQEQVEISHPVCIHKGADHCDLIIRFK